MAGSKSKAPPGTVWRGNVLHSDFQVQGKAIRVSLKTDDPGIAKTKVADLKKRVLAEVYHGGGPRQMIDIIGEWKTHMEGKPGLP